MGYAYLTQLGLGWPYQSGIDHLWELPTPWNTIQGHNQIGNILTIHPGSRLSSGLCLPDTTRPWKALPG